MKKLVVLFVIVGLGVGLGVWIAQRPPPPLKPFAQCLREKGAAMYGAIWCGYCKQQKALFGAAGRVVPYVECAMPGNPQGQTPACREKDLKGYPTWIFADGSRVSGVQTLEFLAEKTGCDLPAVPTS